MTAIKNFFKAILYKPFFNVLVFFAYLVPGHSIGWAIIGLTLLVKILLWAPSIKALKSPLQMRQYQKDIQELQERYKDDRTAQAQALMTFYKEKGINPVSGCLTLIIQLPVILILYRVFVVGLHNIRPDLIYSFTPHLNSINPFFLGVDLAKPSAWTFPVVAAIIQFLQSRQMAAMNPSASKNSADPSAMMTKQMQYLFPIMTFIVGRSLPAGLSLYWAVSTLFSLGQQVYLARMYKNIVPAATVSVRTKKR